MSHVLPFKIAVSEENIIRLKQKLALTDFPDEVSDSEPWSRGAPLSDIKRLAAYWENGFDWRKAETALNEFPQYTTKIEVEGFDTYDVHFVHQKSTANATYAIPLLFIHGWPGSFIEVTKLVPHLVQGGTDFPAFHVVAPSLIDFGFSSGSKKNGFTIDQHAEVCHKLMQSLGYDEYVVQGGDLGYVITRFIALKYGPKHCKGYLTNSVLPAEPNATLHPELYAQSQATPLTLSEIAGLQRSAAFQKDGDGYLRQQSTKPQTIGYSIADSPVGLLAWLYEKLHDWSDNYAWTDDEILTWVSIYYFSKAGPAASALCYYEMEHRQPSAFAASQVYIDVPFGVARFQKDLVLLPKLWSRTLGPVVYESESESGGHFAAWERPDVIIRDLRTMLGDGGPAHEVVKGKCGYLE